MRFSEKLFSVSVFFFTEPTSVTEQLKVYTEEDHLKRKSDDIVELYETFKTAILNLSDDIEIEYRKDYIAFKKSSNIADINVKRKGIKLWINLKPARRP